MDQAPGIMVPYTGGMAQSASVPMMMVPAYGYPPQGQPMMMQPVVMPGAAPAGISMSFQQQPQPTPVMMNVRPNGIYAESTAQITVVDGQAMVRVVSPDGQMVLLPLGNQVQHEAPTPSPTPTTKTSGVREGETHKAMSHQ